MDTSKGTDIIRQPIVVIAKRGRAPQIVRDNFNLAGIVDSISNIADKVTPILDKATTVINKVGQTVTTVKDAAGNIKQIVSPPKTTSVITSPSYSLPASFGSIDPNVLLMVGGSAIVLIVVVLITRR